MAVLSPQVRYEEVNEPSSVGGPSLTQIPSRESERNGPSKEANPLGPLVGTRIAIDQRYDGRNI
jgi:hypothetical protein